MVIHINWTESAKQELKNIFLYFQDVAGNKVASQIRTQIISSTIILKSHLEIGQVEEFLNHRDEKFRYLVSSNYKIIYRNDLDNNTIYIIDVFDTRQDPSKLLSNN